MSDLEEAAIDEAEERLGWAMGMRAENQGLRLGIHRAIDVLEAGDAEGAEAKLRALVGRAQQSGGAK